MGNNPWGFIWPITTMTLTVAFPILVLLFENIYSLLASIIGKYNCIWLNYPLLNISNYILRKLLVPSICGDTNRQKKLEKIRISWASSIQIKWIKTQINVSSCIYTPSIYTERAQIRNRTIKKNTCLILRKKNCFHFLFSSINTKAPLCFLFFKDLYTKQFSFLLSQSPMQIFANEE